MCQVMPFRPCYMCVGTLSDPDCVALVLAALALASHRAQTQDAYPHPEDRLLLAARLVVRITTPAVRVEDNAK